MLVNHYTIRLCKELVKTERLRPLRYRDYSTLFKCLQARAWRCGLR